MQGNYRILEYDVICGVDGAGLYQKCALPRFVSMHYLELSVTVCNCL